uniref:SAWADEE domain-containing protein n=1 Tax=Steinernema glaseri TaxID=37863 RepID=A0A1I7YRD2_9BILA
MDTVPWIFVESVCLCLLDRRSRTRSTKLSVWGKICTATRKKIHTLRVLLDGERKKIYAAAEPIRNSFSFLDHSNALDSVDLKFVTNFRIEACTYHFSKTYLNTWKEITLDDLQRLVHFITPVRNERHPLSCNGQSLNTLLLCSGDSWINENLLSMQLPVGSVVLLGVEANEFFETAGSFYHVCHAERTLKQSAIDAIIEKFVPIDGGSFDVNQKLSDKQLKKLFEKCATANKRVSVSFIPEDIWANKTVTIWAKPKDYTKILDSTGPIDYDKYYSEREVIQPEREVRFVNEDKEKLKLQVRLYEGTHRYASTIEWMWLKASLKKLELPSS